MKKGFTLIELLIVIAILAVLATIIVLVLNPAQLLAEARDSQRLQDLDTLRSAINFVLVRATTTVSIGSTANCHLGQAAGGTNCHGRHDGTYGAIRATQASASRLTDGTGWLPVNLTIGGPPISVLPVDPSNTTTYFYSYLPGPNSTFEVNAVMESAQYTDRHTTDGGNHPNVYEIGTASGLSL